MTTRYIVFYLVFVVWSGVACQETHDRVSSIRDAQEGNAASKTNGYTERYTLDSHVIWSDMLPKSTDSAVPTSAPTVTAHPTSTFTPSASPTSPASLLRRRSSSNKDDNDNGAILAVIVIAVIIIVALGGYILWRNKELIYTTTTNGEYDHNHNYPEVYPIDSPDTAVALTDTTDTKEFFGGPIEAEEEIGENPLVDSALIEEAVKVSSPRSGSPPSPTKTKKQKQQQTSPRSRSKSPPSSKHRRTSKRTTSGSPRGTPRSKSPSQRKSPGSKQTKPKRRASSKNAL